MRTHFARRSVCFGDHIGNRWTDCNLFHTEVYSDTGELDFCNIGSEESQLSCRSAFDQVDGNGTQVAQIIRTTRSCSSYSGPSEFRLLLKSM